MNMEIAERLYSYRRKSNLSQEQLAEKVGVSRQAISKWERAEASPDTENLIMLAKIYGVTLDELVNFDPEITDIAIPDEAENRRTAEPESKSEESVPEENKDAESKDSVSFMNGIHVRSKNGDKVDIDFTGIHVDSVRDDTHVHIDKDGISVNDNGHIFQKNRTDNKPSSQRTLEKFPYPVLAAAIYFIFGIFDICGGWSFGWIVFLTIPLYYTLISAFYSKNPTHFAFPVLIVIIYLILGFGYSLWHPMWILFLSVPLYYFLCSFISELMHSPKRKSDAKNSDAK